MLRDGKQRCGSKIEVAFIIFRLVRDDLKLKDKLQGSIVKRASRQFDKEKKNSPNAKKKLSSEDIKQGFKNIRKNFKSWFKESRIVATQMPEYCAKLKLDHRFVEDATFIAHKIQHSGLMDGCQPQTIAAVVLYMLNLRLPDEYKIAEQ